MPRQTNIQIRRGTASDWASVNPTLAAGELAVDDAFKLKVGDGTTAYNDLQYVRADGGDLDASEVENSCPAPSMRILLADGSSLAAGELKPGMLVRTRHEETMEESSYEVSHASIVQAERVSLRMGEIEFVCSLSHKFRTGSGWVKAKDLNVGDEVAGQPVLSKEEIGVGEVVKITVEGAHTYVCEGFLSHNKSVLNTTTTTTSTTTTTTTTAAPTTTTTTTTTPTPTPSSPTSIIVSGAGVYWLNGTYNYIGDDEGGRPIYELSGDPWKHIRYGHYWSQWAIEDDSDPYYTNASDSMTVPASGWNYYPGTSSLPVPTFTFV